MSPSDDFPPASGSVLDGRFRVERALGSGGMGVVVAAEHLALGRRVAIKLLKPELVGRGDIEGRFLREARAIARLRSEHVVLVLDVGTLSTGIPYIVMEHLSGIDLGACLTRRGPLPVGEVVECALQTLEALAEAHRQGIVHRDLKPSNLFLTTPEHGSPCIKVLDFGVSKLIGWEVTGDGMVTKKGMVLGSPLYMSPEHIRDSSTVDARTDIWSLGAVMHELLTGQAPFDRGGLPMVIRAVCAEPYRPPERPDLPPELRAILVQCLTKRRTDRFQDAAALGRAFQPLVRTATAQVSVDRIVHQEGAAPRGFAGSMRYEETVGVTAPQHEAAEENGDERVDDTTIPDASESRRSFSPTESDAGNWGKPKSSLRLVRSLLLGVAAAAVVATVFWFGMHRGGGRAVGDGGSNEASASDPNALVAPAAKAVTADAPRGVDSNATAETRAPVPDTRAPDVSAPRATGASGTGPPRAAETKPGYPSPTPAAPAPPAAKVSEPSATAAFPLGTTKPPATTKPLGALPPPPTPTERAKKRPLDTNPFAK